MVNLIQGDCVEELSKLEGNSIDICITDIPYGIDYSEWDVKHNNTNKALGGSSTHQEKDTTFRRRGKPINGWSKADRNIGKEYEEWCNKWAKELNRVLKEGSPVLIFSSRRLQHRVCNALENNDLYIKDILIWKKDRCNAKAQRIEKVLKNRGITDDKYANYRIGNLAPYYEPIIYAMKGYSKTVTDCVIENGVGGFIGLDDKIPSNIIECKVNSRNRYHETEKPIELIKYLIQLFSIEERQVILDFTMGSGTTGVACKELNRCFIGIERNEKYYEIARKRNKGE